MPEGQSEGGAVGAMKAQLGDRDRLLDLQIKSSQSVSQTNRSASQPALFNPSSSFADQTFFGFGLTGYNKT